MCCRRNFSEYNLMSVYSGFVTRSLETTYNKALYNLLFLLQTKIYRNATEHPLDEVLFTKYLKRLYQTLFELEKSKHMAPKYSYALKDLATQYGFFEDEELSLIHICRCRRAI
eukprot:TRINITY_DN3399_c0_g1_i16.p1 TRINITY_DN3399_c0_g1~~TRINITY_DN3399_c0_g1_i16.p1  ORF type:complete len:113 (-),score=29.00 TRINITY_DN3399_c0_g1_i16:53-391(-)